MWFWISAILFVALIGSIWDEHRRLKMANDRLLSMRQQMEEVARQVRVLIEAR